jgi:hypothetical protein
MKIREAIKQVRYFVERGYVATYKEALIKCADAAEKWNKFREWHKISFGSMPVSKHWMVVENKLDELELFTSEDLLEELEEWLKNYVCHPPGSWPVVREDLLREKIKELKEKKHV